METIDCFINQIIEGVKVLKQIGLKDKRSSSVKQGIRRNIQYYTDNTEWVYSIKAKQLCDNLGLDINKLPKYKVGRLVGGDKNKPALIGEHTTPISELISILIDTPLDEIKYLIKNYSPVCWITREEDERLNSNGYSRKRPNGWEFCYKDCGITLFKK
jgi:hypothetical protein